MNAKKIQNEDLKSLAIRKIQMWQKKKKKSKNYGMKGIEN